MENVSVNITEIVEVVNIDVTEGLRGEKGEQGIQGIKGDTGEQGIQGIQGIQGEKGEDGKDTYVATTTSNTTIELAVATETYCTTSSAAFTFTLQTPISGRVNESVVIFKTSTTPIITHPIGTIWLGSAPTFSASETWIVVYEQVYNGTAYFIYGTAIKKV